MIAAIRKISPDIKQGILTNGTELYRDEVRKNLLGLDKIIFKLDVSNNDLLQKVNRPASGVTLEKIIAGFKELQKEFKNELEIQSMFMPINEKQLEEFAEIISELKPNLVQLNTPQRPYPMEWHKENRGNHAKIFDYETRDLKVIVKDDSKKIEKYLKEKTGVEILSIYR